MKLTESGSTRARSVTVLALAVLTGAAVLAAVAIAHTAHYPNHVTLTKAVLTGNPGQALYKGRVVSSKDRCEVNREVQVFHVQPNGAVRVARGRSNGAGDWKASGSRVPNGDKVYALIETKVLKANANHDHSCKVDRSSKRAFPYP
jgi:hypothetical protein